MDQEQRKGPGDAAWVLGHRPEQLPEAAVIPGKHSYLQPMEAWPRPGPSRELGYLSREQLHGCQDCS